MWQEPGLQVRLRQVWAAAVDMMAAVECSQAGPLAAEHTSALVNIVVAAAAAVPDHTVEDIAEVDIEGRVGRSGRLGTADLKEGSLLELPSSGSHQVRLVRPY